MIYYRVKNKPLLKTLAIGATITGFLSSSLVTPQLYDRILIL
jgi:hypothetical protein